MDNATLTISLPKAMKSFIEAKLREGQFSTPSEYIRSLIRDDQHLAGNKELALLLRHASAPLQTAGAQAEETRKRRK